MNKPYSQPSNTIKHNMTDYKLLTKDFITLEINVIGLEILRCGLLLAWDQLNADPPYGLESMIMVEHLDTLFGKEFADTEEILNTLEWVAKQFEEHRDGMLGGTSDPNLN